MGSRLASAVTSVAGVARAPVVADASIRVDLLHQLELTLESVISDDGGAFVTAICRDADARRVVLKYIHRGSSDASRRLRNEITLFQQLSVHPPLRLLVHRRSGPEYLLTEFDSGILLRPDAINPRMTESIAQALVQFQGLQTNLQQHRVHDREHLATYYLKVLLKNLAHLWPAHISTTEAVRCQAIVAAALPAICRTQVICHGDFLPTNLLYHPNDDSITFTDLEGFISGNHPLFDVLAICTIGSAELTGWEWQRLFLSRYLSAGRATLRLDPRSRDYLDAYRAILIFFLVYRMSEQRMDLTGGAYFEGVSKARFLSRKAGGLLRGRRAAWHDDALGSALQVRQQNLRRALSPSGYREHFEMMHASAAVAR